VRLGAPGRVRTAQRGLSPRRKLRSRHGCGPQCEWKIRAQLLRIATGREGDGGHLIINVRLTHSGTPDATPTGLSDQIEQRVLIGDGDDNQKVRAHQPIPDNIEMIVLEGECRVDCLGGLQTWTEVCANGDVQPVG
jgi:hypothetical protein